MCGMGNLTRAAYANQRIDAFCKTSPKYKMKRNTMIALRGAIHSGVFSSFMFHQGRLAMPYRRRGCLGTRHFFSAQRGGGV